jgi:hypothetical protein
MRLRFSLLPRGNQSGPWLTCGVSVLGSTV